MLTSKFNDHGKKLVYGTANVYATPMSSLSEESKSFRKPVYLSSLVAAFGGALCGYDTGCISSIIAMKIFKVKFFTEYSYTYLEGLLLVSYLMTAALGSLSSGYFCDRFSRKYSIIGSSMVFCTGLSFQITGYKFELVCTGRLITGFGAGLLTNSINLYHSEISPPDIRGRLTSLFTLMTSFGQVVGYFITFATSYLESDWCWRGPWLIQLIFGAVFGIFVVTLPFSPRWLLNQGRHKEALLVLVELNGLPQSHATIQKEYNAMRTEIDFERSLGKQSYHELFAGANLKRTLFAFFISSSTSFTGSVAIWYYAPQIWVNAGMTDVSASIVTTAGSGVLSLVATALSLHFLVDSVGRVPLFKLGAALMALSMFIVGVMFARYTLVDVDSGQVSVVNINARKAIIACIYIFTASFAFSYGIGSYVYPAEVFSMRCRAKGLSLTFGLNWVFSILITYSVPLFMSFSVSIIYFFFCGCCVVIFIGTWFIPETKGRTLENMTVLFAPKTHDYLSYC
ncbi:general substrate transporter [Absidia repens]|uniref:General substrate transporter n=1 Tax=Absidia repens TaxID=90262 RepID=A0A1X2J0C3_9FUNG|nr:general substrate transporter [Absidia repens]